MDRRTYLGTATAAGAVAAAGCLGGIFDDDSGDTVLPPQDDLPGDPENYSFPGHGERLPSFALADPVADTVVETADLNRTTVVTTFFATCPAECGILINNLAGAQAATVERNLVDDVVFLAVTFDPDRDDADVFRDNAATNGVDLTAGNWHYLRPDTPEHAHDIVADEDGGLGIPYQRVEESDRLQTYDFDHIVVTLLANPGGVVERVYRGENFDRNRLVEDTETVAEEYDPAEHG